jgi:hypothetical protein
LLLTGTSFIIGCSVRHDQRQVEAASLNQRVAPAVTGAPVQPARPPGPILLDDDGDILASAGNPSSLRILPTLNLETHTADGKTQVRVTPAPAPLFPARYFAGALTLNAATIDFGTEVTGTVILDAGKDALRLVWIDSANRVIAAMALDTKAGGSADFTFKMPSGAFGNSHKLALVRVSKDGRLKVEAVAPLQIRETVLWDDFVLVSTDDKAEKLFPAQAVRLEFGLHRTENPLYLENYDALAAKYAKERDPKIFERVPPLFDQPTIDGTLEAIRKNHTTATGGLSLWALGGGVDFSNHSAPLDFDTAPATLDLYREWLHGRYGILRSLNTAWKTAYTDWPSVQPQTTDESKAKTNPAYKLRLEALKKGDPTNKLEKRGEQIVFSLQKKDLRKPGGENFSAWADFRAFNNWAVARLLREFKEQSLKVDPRSENGVYNLRAPTVWGGWEYDSLSRSFDWAEEHNSAVARELVRSFAPKTHLLTLVSSEDPSEIHRLWDRWLRGDNGALLRAPAEGKALPVEDLRVMAHGLTQLRNSAQKHNDPIAVYYSPRSLAIHWMLDSEAEGSTWLDRNDVAEATRGSGYLALKAWLLLLEDLGYAPTFLHPEQVVAGALHYPDVKVLILPKVVCLSTLEAAYIREFAQAGGVVVADGECGTFDALGKRRGPATDAGKPVGALDEDFGIGRHDLVSFEVNGQFTGEPRAAHFTLRGKGDTAIGPDSPELRVIEPGVVPLGAVAHASTAGGIKAIFSQSARGTGDKPGRFFYLNMSLQDYPQLRAERTSPNFEFHGTLAADYVVQFGEPTGGEAIRLTIADILAEVAGENVLSVRWENGTAARGIKSVRYDLGNNAAFYALLPLADFDGDENRVTELNAPLPDTLNATVANGSEHYWYDMRRGEALGKSVGVKVKLDATQPTLLAALPYAVERLSLKTRRLEPGNVFKLNIDVVSHTGQPGRHVFHLDLLDPAGNLMKHYAANVVAENGGATYEVALGINDPAGIYHVNVIDVLTGKHTEGDLKKDVVEYGGLKVDAEATPVEK